LALPMEKFMLRMERFSRFATGGVHRYAMGRVCLSSFINIGMLCLGWEVMLVRLSGVLAS